MHFWIDKPAGRYYGFSGRRYPVVSFPKTHFASHHRCNNLDLGRAPITPVHRFPNNSSTSAGPSSHDSSRSSRSSSQNNSNLDARTYLSQGSMQQETFENNNIGSNSLPQSTNRNGLMNCSEYTDTEMQGYKLRCSLWIIFMTATCFVAILKFYFDHKVTYHQQGGLEALFYSGLLLVFLISGCFYSIFCRRTPNNNQEEIPQNSITTVTISNNIPSENARPVPVSNRQNPPPPYHLAILIPPPLSPDEAPPPSYDKIIH